MKCEKMTQKVAELKNNPTAKNRNIKRLRTMENRI